MNLLKKYFDLIKIKQEIYDYFEYKEGWGPVFPIDDCTKYYWKICQEEYCQFVICSLKKENLLEDNEDDDYNLWDIYIHNSQSKGVYKGKEYTMICVDLQKDENDKWLIILDNFKELKENEK